MLDKIGYLAVAVILLTYFIGGAAFDVANVVCNIPLVIIGYKKRAYQPMIISLSFGLIGLYKLLN